VRRIAGIAGPPRAIASAGYSPTVSARGHRFWTQAETLAGRSDLGEEGAEETRRGHGRQAAHTLVRMLRKIALVGFLAIAWLIAVVPPAWAPCIAVDAETVAESEAVWWVTVTDAVSPRDRDVQLTVRIDDVLKGPGELGATVPASRPAAFCSVFTRINQATADRLVGQQLLLAGDINGRGKLQAWPEINDPDGLPPEQQYREALAALGIEDRMPPDGSHTPWRDEEAGAPWWTIPALAALAIAIAIALGMVAFRRRGASKVG